MFLTVDAPAFFRSVNLASLPVNVNPQAPSPQSLHHLCLNFLPKSGRLEEQEHL